jgi:hypothetical protein
VPYSRAGSVNSRLEAVMAYYGRTGTIDREKLFEDKFFTVDMDLMLQVGREVNIC